MQRKLKMPEFQKQFQIGKNGLTSNFIGTLKNYFRKNKKAKISVLKNAGHTKEKTKEYSNKILKELGTKYTSKVIGFSIFIKKWRKEKR